MALVKVFKERDKGKYKEHTFDNELDHLEYLMTKYVVEEEKVLSKETSGVRCNDNPKIAFEEMISTKQEFNKYNPENTKSREFKHYTISFNYEESKKLGAGAINKICKDVIERIPEFNNFQVSIATHEDKQHIHSHIIVNSVNMVTGKKIQLDKGFITRFQYILNEYTKNLNLETHKLPYELKHNEENKSYNYVDYIAHSVGNISKTEQFARRIEKIIKKTKNRYELFKEIKNNNLFMKWTDDSKYKNTLNIGKITIIDNETKEKHRLEKLVKNYNIDISHNIDLVNHFKDIDKNNEFKKNYIIKNIRINKNNIIKVNNIEDIKKAYHNVREQIKEKKKITFNDYYKLDSETKVLLDKLTNNIYDNSETLKNEVENKVNELLIKAKEENKDLEYSKEKQNIENKLFMIINNKIIKEIVNNDTELFNTDFLIKAICKSIRVTNRNNLNDDRLNNKNIDNEKEKEIEKALKY